MAHTKFYKRFKEWEEAMNKERIVQEYVDHYEKEHTEEELRIKFWSLVTIGLAVVIFVLGLIVGFVVGVRV